jgi:signal transduction histidine kinase/ligand-binding sensor domain-containing protein
MRFIYALVVICLTLSSVPVAGQDATAATLLRKRFGAAEGSPPLISQLAQTNDGFLWMVGDGSNLVRFDGRNFYRFDKSEAVNALAAAPNGDLWIAEPSRLLRIPAESVGRFTLTELEVHVFSEQGLRIGRLEVSRQGVLWIATTHGMFRYDQNGMAAVGPRIEVRNVSQAEDGRMLVPTVGGILDIADSTVRQPQALSTQLGVSNGDIIDAMQDSHGGRWYVTPLGVAREFNGQLERIAPYGPNQPVPFHVHEDAHGQIWVAKDTGLFRLTPEGFELVAPGMQVRDLFNDRDGNLWVGTYGDGLHRIKAGAVRMFTTADGLPGSNIMRLLEAHDGTIWAGANCGGIARFDGRRFHAISRQEGLSNACVVGLAEDSNRDLWIGTSAGAFKYRNGAFDLFAKADGLPDQRITHILHARDGSLWFGTLRGGLARLSHGTLRTFTTADGLPANNVTRTIQDRAGVIWAGTSQGIARLVDERFEAVSNIPGTNAFPIGADRDGGVYVTHRTGKGNVTNRIDRAGSATPTGFDIASLVETSNGDLWIGGSRLARVWPGELSRLRPPDDLVEHEIISSEDGLEANAAQSGAFYDMILARDGAVWAATPHGVARLEPRRLPMTRERPLVYLTGVTIGRNTTSPEPNIVLPQGTAGVEIDFAAVDITAPEKIRMQYMLEGVDPEWRDAGAAQKATYNTLPPGRHALRIRASNRSGIWDREGVVFSVTQLPFFYQTGWFASVMVATVLLAITAAHRRRVRRISRAMTARFDERLAERTRVARELHDTLLQTVHGSKLVAEFALKDPSDHDRLLRALRQLSTWLAKANEEGRAAVEELRASPTETNNLAGALRRAIEECRVDSAIQISSTVRGASREMHPVVRDEAYRIGYEAIRNACLHASATRIDVVLEYGRDLTLRVNDNGVGIDAAVVERGKDGHFGLRGMRERAQRIEATLTVRSGPGTGTDITLIVPGRSAFRST